MKTNEIVSPNNSAYKALLRLTKARGIKKRGMALISGPKQTREVLKEFRNRCEGIIFSQNHEPPSGAGDIPSYRLSSELFRQIDSFDTGHPILIVRFEPFPEFVPDRGAPGCTLCLPFQDPANVGSAIRSAAAFGVSKVVMLKESAHPFHPRSVRAAGSNIFRVQLFEGPPLEQLKSGTVPIISLSPVGEDVAGYRFPHEFCLVPGLEGPGIPDRLGSAMALSVPMEPGVESLNAAMATGIVLYLWRIGLGRGRKGVQEPAPCPSIVE